MYFPMPEIIKGFSRAIVATLVLLSPISFAQDTTPPDADVEPSEALAGIEPAGPLSLRKALELALRSNPQLAVYSWDMRIAEAQQIQAGLRPNPELSLEIEDIRWSDGPDAITTSSATGGGPAGVEREIEEGASAGFGESEFTLQISQLIELGGKRAKRIQVSESDHTVAQWGYEIARADVLARVASAYTTVLGMQKQVRLAEETVALAEEVVDVIETRVSAGEVSPIELARAEVERNQSRIELNQRQRALLESRYVLASSWGATSPVFTEAIGTLEVIEELASFESLESNIADNPDLQRWVAELDRRDALMDLERAKRVPDLTVALGVRTEGLESRDVSRYGLGTDPPTLLEQGSTGYDQDRSNTMVLEFSVPLPLFNRNQGGIKESEYLAEKAGAQWRATELRIRTALRTVYENLRAAEETVRSLSEEVLPKATEVYEATNEGYREGKFTYLAVLEAQRTLVDARGRHIDALVSYHQARIRMERLVGATSGLG